MTKSKNALSHGVYSEHVVLPWEDKQEFCDLHEGLRNEWLPDGVSEEEAVLDLAKHHWLKRRLTIGSQMAFVRAPGARTLADAGCKGWGDVAEHFSNAMQNGETERELGREVRKASRGAVLAFWSVVSNQAERMLAEPRSEETLAEVERTRSLILEMKAASHVMAPMLEMIERSDFDEQLTERAYAPQRMERDLKICAEIDKRIEKTIWRMMVIKDHKRLQRERQIKVVREVKTLAVVPQISEPAEPERSSSSTTDAESPTLVPK
jgi:hypothetical protein